MANYGKTNAVGIDYIINKAQLKIFNDLNDLGYDINGYGKCYITQDETNGSESFIPKFYKGTQAGKVQNENVLYAEGNKFFFTVGKSIRNVGKYIYEAELSIYFIVDLNKVKPNVLHRADSEVHKDCYNIVSQCGFGDFDLEIEIRNVLSDFKVLGKDKAIDATDIQPYHVFKFKTKSTKFDIRKQCNIEPIQEVPLSAIFFKKVALEQGKTESLECITDYKYN